MTLRRPAPLRPGARIGVVAPGSAPRREAALHDGIARLEALGYEVLTHRTDFSCHGYLGGTDAVRLDEFNSFLRRDDVGALFCVRGGYGALRLLHGLDYEAARHHPKLLVGYSDVTALHLALYEKACWPGLSGPMVAVEWNEEDKASERLFWDLAQGGTPDPLLGPHGEVLVPVRPGAAEGVLLGGNLAVLTKLVGTPYLPALDGALLFLEEVGEEPYRVDGLLAQLKLSGILDRLGGLILGAFTEADPKPDRPSLPLDEVFAHYTNDLSYPVARGLVYGHFSTKNTLPVGVRARLAVDNRTAHLSILEPVVA